MDDLLLEFVAETEENLAVLDQQLVAFENTPNDDEILGNIFRTMHTIKGTCGFLNLPRLEQVAHAGEDVLGQFRDHTVPVTADAVSMILAALDQIRAILTEIGETGEEPAGSDEDLIRQLRAVAEGGSSDSAEAASAAAEEASEDAAVVDESSDAPNESSEGASTDSPEEMDDGPNIGEGGFPVAKELMEEFEAIGDVDNTSADTDDAAEDDALTVDAAMEDVDTEVAALADELMDSPAVGEDTGNDGVVITVNRKPVTLVKNDAEPVAPTLVEESPVAQEEQPPVAQEEEAPVAQVEAEPAAGPAAKPEAKEAPAAGAKKAKSSAGQSIRVNVDVLEDLMTMVSEMVLTRNQLQQLVRNLDAPGLDEPIQRLSRVTSELQEGVMKTRMQPIGNAWSKLPRIIRDLSNELGKKIDLVMVGEDTELDRQVLELIADPLTHMVRNSADHGLETPDERALAGKSETGTITLSARHEGGHIILEIIDDGRGLNTKRIRDKVLERGLATAAELDGMDEGQIHQFVMKPGFSTAQAVTKVSGRGVGMDVVRSNIEQIGGHLDFSSVEGEGSRFSIKIPLTLAIVSALIVEVQAEKYAIPQITVQEIVRVKKNSQYQVDMIHDSPVLRFRNRLLPLIHLESLLNISDATLQEKTDVQDFEGFVVVCKNGNQNLGIIVSAISDSEEIVVKPLSGHLKNIRFFSGNTILGDGRVILILDPAGLASTLNEIAVPTLQDDADSASATSNTESILLFKVQKAGVKAVPLSEVNRIEDQKMDNLEMAQGRMVTQYRGQLLPIYSLDGDAGIRRSGRQTVLVFGNDSGMIGLAIESIVDIAQEELNITSESRAEGIKGSAIIAGSAVDVLDTEFFQKDSVASKAIACLEEIYGRVA